MAKEKLPTVPANPTVKGLEKVIQAQQQLSQKMAKELQKTLSAVHGNRFTVAGAFHPNKVKTPKTLNKKPAKRQSKGSK